MWRGPACLGIAVPAGQAIPPRLQSAIYQLLISTPPSLLHAHTLLLMQYDEGGFKGGAPPRRRSGSYSGDAPPDLVTASERDSDSESSGDPGSSEDYEAPSQAHCASSSSHGSGRPASAAAGGGGEKGNGTMPGLTPGERFLLFWGASVCCMPDGLCVEHGNSQLYGCTLSCGGQGNPAQRMQPLHW